MKIPVTAITGCFGKKDDGVDIVFHTAAFKHIVLCEKAPFEDVQTTVLETESIVRAAVTGGVRGLFSLVRIKRSIKLT
ncbi:MAG: FlaA1/EpsC-like NDP-sugar epimerase [Pseudohongiellaceae bacterium]